MLAIWSGRYVSDADINCINEDGADAELILDWGTFLGTSREAVVEQMRAAWEAEMFDLFEDGPAKVTVGNDPQEGDFFDCTFTDCTGTASTMRAWFRVEERLI